MKKRRVYIFSPLPPVKSGIARYTNVLVENLEKDYDIHVITAQTDCSSAFNDRVHHWKEFLYRSPEQDAILIYQIGNNPDHGYAFPFLFTYPGIVILHDFILTDIRLMILGQFHSSDEIARELEYCLNSVSSAKHVHDFLKNGLSTERIRFLYPEVNRMIVEQSLVTVVHNPDTREALSLMYPEHPICYFPLGFCKNESFEEMSHETIQKKRMELGFPKNVFILGHFGVLSGYKRVKQLFELVSRLRAFGYPAFLLIVGFEGGESIDLKSMANAYGIRDCIRHYSNLPDNEYRDMIQITDVGYSLRFPSAGEFSLSIAELMAYAKPVILLQHRFSAYLPDDVCVKIRPTEEMNELVHHTVNFYQNPDLRYQMGNSARMYIENHNSIQSMIDGYRGVIEAFDYFRKNLKRPPPNFPNHLQPLQTRVIRELADRFPCGVPKMVQNSFEELLNEKVV